MRSDDIEIALRELLGASAGDKGLVLTLRRHDEYEALIERIRVLEKENESLKGQVLGMSEFANLLLIAMDELRTCRKYLDKLGVDTSFITSLRPR